MNPLEILPSETWENIFNRVNNPTDWLHFYRANSSFETVVGTKKTQVLLPQVLPFVLKHLLDEGLNRMLSIRLLSKGFREGVDNFMDLSSNRNTNLCKSKYSFHDFATLSSFVEMMESKPGTVIIGRFFALDYKLIKIRMLEAGLQREEAERVQHNILLLVSRGLAISGNNLTHVDISDRFYDQADCDDFLNLIRDLVRLAPNLETLCVSCCDRGNPNIVFPHVKNRPVPVFSKLRCLMFQQEYMCTIPKGVQNAILSMTCNPDSLRNVVVYGVPTELLNFTKLEILEIREIDSEQDRINLKNARWPLSQLEFYCERLAGWELFGYAHKFRNTLTSLTVEIENSTEPVESFPFQADLPHLKFLAIMENIPLDICANLDNLEILRVMSENIDTEEEADEFAKDIRQKAALLNLWGLPNLKTIVAGGPSYDPGYPRELRRDHTVENVVASEQKNPRIFVIILKLLVLVFRLVGNLGLAPFLILLVALKIIGI